jgi:hypothetical protein
MDFTVSSANLLRCSNFAAPSWHHQVARFRDDLVRVIGLPVVPRPLSTRSDTTPSVSAQLHNRDALGQKLLQLVVATKRYLRARGWGSRASEIAWTRRLRYATNITARAGAGARCREPTVHRRHLASCVPTFTTTFTASAVKRCFFRSVSAHRAAPAPASRASIS